MSWSTSGSITTIKSGPTTVDFPSDSPQTTHAESESKTAIDAAKKAAQTLLETGAFGYGNFGVRLNGHANPGNVPCSGWANDCVSMEIEQRTPAAAQSVGAT